VGPGARAGAVLALGALALHELRYLLGYGAEANAALSHHGHGYMEQLVPALVAMSAALIAAAVIAPLAGLAGASARGRGVLARAPLYAGLLLGVFWSQELAEAVLAGGHPGALEPLIGHGAWTAVPLAVLLGLAAALATGGLELVERRLAGVPPRHVAARDPLELGSRGTGAESRPLAALTLAFGLARRPPPAAL
jgi:hypothetical protein